MDWETVIRIAAIIGVALILFLISRPVIRSIMKQMITHRMAGEDKTEIDKRTNTLSSILQKISGIILLIIAVVMILPEVGVNIAALIATIGVGGLAIAFAAQSLVKDYISGFFIILEDQYRVEDVVAIAGVSGSVEEIGLRRTILRDVGGNVHSVPNGKVELSTNMTKKLSRINLDISVGYGENLERVMGVINNVCLEMAGDPQWKPDLLTTPAVARINNLGDSGIDIKITGDVKPGRQWAVMGELRLRVKNTFDAEGIEIPWPHTKVFFGNTPADLNKN
ncbi:MAG: mechanosensitive ion channel family protein [Dehalococcoidales bacterium]|nr:mechanosensitive ion channel family protein [Dehalococcoidales bacterium]